MCEERAGQLRGEVSWQCGRWPEPVRLWKSGENISWPDGKCKEKHNESGRRRVVSKNVTARGMEVWERSGQRSRGPPVVRDDHPENYNGFYRAFDLFLSPSLEQKGSFGQRERSALDIHCAYITGISMVSCEVQSRQNRRGKVKGWRRAAARDAPGARCSRPLGGHSRRCCLEVSGVRSR
jgi:hypothetical protein